MSFFTFVAALEKACIMPELDEPPRLRTGGAFLDAAEVDSLSESVDGWAGLDASLTFGATGVGFEDVDSTGFASCLTFLAMLAADTFAPTPFLSLRLTREFLIATGASSSSTALSPRTS